MKTSSLAFSLTELLVAIVIAGILAAVAVPAYLSHTKKVKLAEINRLIEHYTDLSIETYSLTGTFGNVADVGLTPENPADPTYIQPSDPNNYLLGSISMFMLLPQAAGAAGPNACAYVSNQVRIETPVACGLFNYVYDEMGEIKKICIVQNMTMDDDCSVYFPECLFLADGGNPVEIIDTENTINNACP